MFNQKLILAGKPMYQIDFLAHKNDLNFGRDETLSKRINSRIDGLIKKFYGTNSKTPLMECDVQISESVNYLRYVSSRQSLRKSNFSILHRYRSLLKEAALNAHSE